MASSLPPPPTDYDLSDNFAPVDKRNIGGQGCFNAGVYVVKSKRSGNKYVEKKFSPKNIDDGRFIELWTRLLAHVHLRECRVRDVRFART